MLEDLGLEFSQRKLVRRVSEINRAILSDIQIVRTTKRHAVSLRAQRGNLSIGIDCEQTFDGIGDDQVSVVIEYQAERPALSVRENFWTGAVSREAKDATVCRPAVDSILIVDGHVFGRKTIDGQALDLREF